MRVRTRVRTRAVCRQEEGYQKRDATIVSVTTYDQGGVTFGTYSPFRAAGGGDTGPNPEIALSTHDVGSLKL